MAYSFALRGLFFILLPCLTIGQLWNLAHYNISIPASDVAKCQTIKGLSRTQKSLCRNYNNHIRLVLSGSSLGLQECKFQMKTNRWNCTIPSDSPPDKALHVGSREAAFSYAITAAGVVHSVAKACKNHELSDSCGCSKRSRPKGLSPDWFWGGCGDDVDYAYGFSNEFIDAAEKENRSKDRKSLARRSMNMHNNEAGRVLVVRMTRPTCKCHGVSGSCSLKTCWMKTPEFRSIGARLKRLYEAAVEMRSLVGGRLKPRITSTHSPSRTDLVFLDSSPDYCHPNHEMGVLGTKGRECNSQSTGIDGCNLMCCGRGYTTKQVEIVSKCHCKFQWCCYVRCETCRVRVLKHICN